MFKLIWYFNSVWSLGLQMKLKIQHELFYVANMTLYILISFHQEMALSLQATCEFCAKCTVITCSSLLYLKHSPLLLEQCIKNRFLFYTILLLHLSIHLNVHCNRRFWNPVISFSFISAPNNTFLSTLIGWRRWMQ